jgi:two-component system sensor histidine kinase FlrB
MLLFVKGARLTAEDFPLPSLLDELAQTLEPQATAKGVGFQMEPCFAGAMLKGDRQAISGALINLLENALQACEPGGLMRLSVGGEGSPFAAFRVEDSGAGIPEAARERLFEPFFTTRGEGSGLGLAIVRQVAEAHGGWVEWAPRDEGGSRFTLYLPFAHKERDDG